jgi:cytochrome c-type biogenesis protein CcmE
LLVGGAVFSGVVAFLLFNTFQSNAVYYYSLSELTAQQEVLTGRILRVNAVPDKASIRNDPKTLRLEFNLVEGELVLPVVYYGVVPDSMGMADSVVAEGKLDADGVFQAQTLLVKCPSKYEEGPAE